MTNPTPDPFREDPFRDFLESEGYKVVNVTPKAPDPVEREVEEFNNLVYKLGSSGGVTSSAGAKLREHFEESYSRIIAEERRKVVEKDDLLDDMWGLICNVNGGIVENEKPVWYTAFQRIRNKYFTSLTKQEYE